MRIEYFLIGGGNKTCLVWECPNDKRAHYAKKLLEDAEQVGFVSDGEFSELIMMGNELCVNGIIAVASQTASSANTVVASGIKNKIHCVNDESKTRIIFELPYEVKANIVIFEGIGFLCTADISVPSKSDLQALAREYSVPAFGIIAYTKNKISPWVYVEETDSLIQESACGSGSIALHLITGGKDIVQPTGEVISVMHEGDIFTVEANVQKLE